MSMIPKLEAVEDNKVSVSTAPVFFEDVCTVETLKAADEVTCQYELQTSRKYCFMY